MQDPRVVQAVHYLTKVPEHTWGLSTVDDFKNWTNQAFSKARSGKGCFCQSLTIGLGGGGYVGG